MKKIVDLRLLAADWRGRCDVFCLHTGRYSNQRSESRNRQSGVALISVLAMLVLLSILIVGFLIRAGSENVASGNYRAVATTRILADTAVNLVQAEINEATTPASGMAWASQPGAIRLFDDKGDLKKIYRLYSAASLVADTGNANVLASDIPVDGTWAASPSIWVDLNAPIKVSGADANLDGTVDASDAYLVYPVLDPRDPTSPGTLEKPTVTTKMPGFSIAASAPVASDLQPAPMPVRWLYVLQDGKIIAPTPDPGGNGKIAMVAGASATNPITGRIAFWTDDETTKVNINTASGSISKRNGVDLPAPWETPKFKMWEERMLFSENQPVQAEYQRYPGHPATTDLYAILNALNVTMTGYPAVMATYSASPQPTPSPTASSFFKMLPRYSDDNSSQGGSATTTKSGVPAKINGGIPKRDRLYTSIGELLYNPQRNPNGLSRQQIESGSFFLTAHSRAPEVTLFGTPRVALWPINATNSSLHRTAFDSLIAFCSTIGKSGANKFAYYIQRSEARSGTNDYDNIARNKELFRYVKNLTAREIPGFGGNFKAKYSVSDESDQIVTEMFDYIRSVNTYDHSLPASNTTYKRFTTNPTGLSGGKSQVTPLKISDGGVNTRALGRIQTLSEIGIVIICTAEGSSTSHLNKVTGSPQTAYAAPETISGKLVSPMKGSANDPAYASNLPVDQYLRDNSGTNGNIVGWDSVNKTIMTGTETVPPSGSQLFPANQTLTTTGQYGDSLAALAPGDKKLQAALLFEVACPMMGFDSLDTAVAPSWQLDVSNIQNVRIDGKTPFPSRTTTGDTVAPNMNGNGAITSMSTRVNQIQGTGGIQGFRYPMLKYATTTSPPATWNARYNGWSGKSPYTGINSPYRYVSNPFTVAAAATGLTFSGDFKVELKVPVTATTTETYQTFNVDFPSPTSLLPIPTLPVVGLMTGATTDTQVWGNNFSIPADWWGFDNRIGWAMIKGSLESTNTTAPVQTMGAVIRGDTTVSGTWSYIYRAKVSQPSFTSQPTSSDVVRTLVAKDGDYRLTAALETVNANGSADFVKGPGYDSGSVRIGNLFRDQSSSLGTAGSDQGGKLVKGVTYSWSWVPKVPATLVEDKMKTWDWDNGLPGEKDGAHAGKADEGNTYVNGGSSPYYNGESQVSNDISSYFTANRIINSAVTFGSLPTGVKEGITWRTLLFRPQKTTGTTDAGRPFDPATGPKDHLFLDLFNMPVVEPYAISEPFSTAGKINMNYQIIPFTYITRSTGLRAVLSSEMIPRVHRVAAANKNAFDQNTWYKGMATSSTPETLPSSAPPLGRFPLNLDETNGTLRQFREKFNSWGLFKSASEICDIYLVPFDSANPSRYLWTNNDQADASWYGVDFAMVGDNTRERPYGNLYPRLTTKSNTFTVHYKVQSLKNPSLTPGQWNEDRGGVTGEFRGSTTLERYIDPANSKIPDYATTPTAASLDTFYQWRIVSTRSFSP